MSTIVIIAVGSRGDVAPLTEVGVCLQQAGHQVVIAAYTPFADLITNCAWVFVSCLLKLSWPPTARKYGL